MEITVGTVEALPDGAGTKGSKYDAFIEPAVQRFTEGDTTTSTRLEFGGATKEQAQSFMRNLSHAANVRGHGIASVLKSEDVNGTPTPVGYFLIRAKRDAKTTNGAAATEAPAKAAAKK